MGVLLECGLVEMLAVLAGGLALIYWYLSRSSMDYWKKRGVYFMKPIPVFGNIWKVALFRSSQGEMVRELYNQMEGHKFGGIYLFSIPALLIRDPDVLKSVLVKDFQNFHDRGLHIDPKNDPLSQHLLFLSGSTWRILRSKITPTFTSGKMKMMFHLMNECAQHLNEYLSNSAQNGEQVELKDVLSKFSTDVIGTCAFGLQTNSLVEPDSEFRRMGKRIFEPGLVKVIERILLHYAPSIAKILGATAYDKPVTEFFTNMVKDTVEYREKNNVKRNDFLQMLIDLKNKGQVDDDHESGKSIETSNNQTHVAFEFTDELMAAQVFIFFLAGFETSSTTMSFCLYELALNPDIQARLRSEVDATLEACDGKITYEVVHQMELLDRVVAETLRKYPVTPVLIRKCTIPYKLPETDITLEKGTTVLIPVLAVQHDPKYYPDPDRFDPERFTEENKAKRNHYTYLPFGEGPRNCIGMRFGLLQTKLGLLTLLSSYEFSVCDRTPIPMTYSATSNSTASKHGYILKISNRR